METKDGHPYFLSGCGGIEFPSYMPPPPLGTNEGFFNFF
jgi:hypothetical protein